MLWRRKRIESPDLKAARNERKRSERLHKEAVILKREIENLRDENHFAESLRRVALQRIMEDS